MRPEYNFWTDEENRIIIDYYPKEGIKVISRLPGRTVSAIKSHTRRIYTYCRKGMKDWTSEELEILRTYYPLEGIKVRDRLPGRNNGAIENKVHKLGIKKARGSKNG